MSTFNRLTRAVGYGVALFLALSGCAAPTIAQQPIPIPTLETMAVLPTADIANRVPPTFTPASLAANSSTQLPSPTAPLPVPTEPPVIETPSPTETAVSQPPTRPFVTIPARAPVLDDPPLTIPCDADGRLFRSTFPSEVDAPTRSYHVYLPPCYGDDGYMYPTLYLFHGSIQNDTHWPDLGVATLLNENIRSGKYPPFIVVMPDNGELGNITSGNDHSIEGVTVNELLPYIEANYCSWPSAEGRSIGGISRGGYWALMMAFRHTDLFTAVSAHSSQLRLEVDRALYNPLATYADADLSQMRIWMDWGETDFLRAGQEQLRDSLEAIDANLEVHVNPGGHNERYWLLHLGDYLDWHASEWSKVRSSYPECAVE